MFNAFPLPNTAMVVAVAAALVLWRMVHCTDAYLLPPTTTSTTTSSRSHHEGLALIGRNQPQHQRMAVALKFFATTQVLPRASSSQQGSSFFVLHAKPNKKAGGSGGDNNNDQDTSKNSMIEMELTHLQNQLSLIEAIEARNEAQLGSFIDEEDQWKSLEEEERQLLSSKDEMEERISLLIEELLSLWMGAKSKDG